MYPPKVLCTFDMKTVFSLCVDSSYSCKDTRRGVKFESGRGSDRLSIRPQIEMHYLMQSKQIVVSPTASEGHREDDRRGGSC